MTYQTLIGLFVAVLAIGVQAVCPHCDGMRQDCLEARAGSKGASGRWIDNVTPKRGWTCTTAEDLGSDGMTECQMCEREQVRYIHHMVHGNQAPLTLDVGCICAGHMMGENDDPASIAANVAAAKQRAQLLENRTRRRTAFPDLQSWKTSKNGNPYLNKDGYNFAFYKGRYGGYSGSVSGERLDGWHRTLREAKLAAFDKVWPPHQA
ncbi:MAG: hypothetical protein C0582_04860 [Alphaproteobacteria bacterium]|nr:MAG: hypothetical protein C0582_04860 [Alphaproteobacteria bacterium]